MQLNGNNVARTKSSLIETAAVDMAPAVLCEMVQHQSVLPQCTRPRPGKQPSMEKRNAVCLALPAPAR
jgi:hypothetical protein